MNFYLFRNSFVSLKNVKKVECTEKANKSAIRFGVRISYFGGETSELESLTAEEQEKAFKEICNILSK